MTSENLFISLLNKYVHNNITPKERDTFFELVATGDYDHLLEQHMLPYSKIDEPDGTDMSDSKAGEMIQRILNADKPAPVVMPPSSTKIKKLSRWFVAASLAGVFILGSYLLFRNDSKDKSNAVAVNPATIMSEKENNTALPMRYQMEDGSVVTLKPLSKLRFPTHFATNKREVYLEGEAFFEVSKNASRPFYVYYESLVTHVLGTSFNVKTDKAKRLVEVSVVTGTVQVYENKSLVVYDNNRKEANGVILTPNQKVIYKEDKRQFTATLVNDPSPIAEGASHSPVKPADFVFNEAPLGNVIKLLEKTYGIEMLTENSRLNNCLFNGDINKYNLYTKLDIICQSLNATYEINGIKILIKGPGCD